MELLKKRIVQDGNTIGNDVVKVDMFLNHQIDVELLNEIGKEFRKRFSSDKITKIVTIEASGIGIACIVAQYFGVPVIFAKKGANRNVGDNLYKADVYSFTKGTTTTIGISKDYLSKNDHVLIVDDFMANGKAVHGLLNILNQAGATVEGIGIVIEKGFQPGGDSLRSLGYKVESLAVIKSIDDGNIIFG
ncbi:MAG: xanthine phosphoribosyltransferase [Clostridia bacterium]|nr:xanthine phosphoribosyltransferase [Clostridia bacterium]MBP3697641.1 xanthine phosphoribosyltransferase [Clostridia bacterium]